MNVCFTKLKLLMLPVKLMLLGFVPELKTNAPALGPNEISFITPPIPPAPGAKAWPKSMAWINLFLLLKYKESSPARAAGPVVTVQFANVCQEVAPKSPETTVLFPVQVTVLACASMTELLLKTAASAILSGSRRPGHAARPMAAERGVCPDRVTEIADARPAPNFVCLFMMNPCWLE
ncbi:hypothetical protein [Roseateles sp.]|uniref:hypothetical protein n=1 Tax=Roseateles sp. TaxID=1971397 RepID=UPI00286A2123|nr:hypothetical protein [Roseateles sp.]